MTVKVLLVGTGSMARVHVAEYAAIDGAEVVGAVDLNAERLNQFADQHNIEHRFTSIDEAIAWNGFDAVSNVTPDAAHFATTMPFLKAGKHVLCEKPLATSIEDANAMADAAQEAGVINAVNFSYRAVPAVQKAQELVASGAIGAVRHFEASYLQSWLTQDLWGDWKTDETWLWRLSTAHGSAGTLGDVGVHILDFASFAAGSLPTNVACTLKTFHKAENDKIGDYTLDANDSFVLSAELENGAIGTVHASRFASGHLNDLYLKLYGTKGGLQIKARLNEEDTLHFSSENDLREGRWTKVVLDPAPSNFVFFIEAILGKSGKAPDFRRGADIQKVLAAAAESDANHGMRTKIES